MDCSGPDKDFSSSAPIKPSAIPKFLPPDAGVADENDLNYEKMGSKLQSPKKPSTKHFMSPTISAASKTVVPRKKILAERNEASTFADTHLQTIPNFGSKTSPMNPGISHSNRSSSRVTPLYSSASESDDDEQNTFIGNSSLKPYDPLTNYLSPRPKFLRYKPNRRREIFLHGENEIREGRDGFDAKRGDSFDPQIAIVKEDSSADVRSSSASSSQEGSVKEEEINKSEDDHDDDVEEEEIEEFEEQRGCSLKGVLKFLLVFVVLFLSTLYISSMNSPTPSPALQAIWGLKDGYHKIQNHIFEAVTVKILEGGSESLDPREEAHEGLVKVKQRAVDDGWFEKEEMVEKGNTELVENPDGLGLVVELQNGQSEDLCDGQLEKTEKVCNQLKRTESAEGEVVYDHELENKGKGFDHFHGTETSETDHELENKGKGFDHFHGTETSETEDVGEHELKKIGENLDQLQGIETAEKSESFEDYQTPIMADLFAALSVSEKEVYVDSSSRDDQVENDVQVEPGDRISDEAAGKEEMVENEMENVQDITNNAGDEIVMPERMDSINTKSDTINPEMEVNSKGIIEHLKAESVPRTVIGFSIFLMIVAPLVLGFHLRRKRTSANDSTPMGKSFAESVIAEKIGLLLPNVEEEEHIEKVESFANPSSLIHSMEEASKELYQRRAPMVELIGEFVVAEVSSTLKSCGMKSRMMESEESNISVSQEKGSQSKVRVVSSQAQPSVSEFSTMDSPSYGSFTAEKKIVKKEEGKDGEVVTTPVRRSSRLRSRAVMSP